MPDVQRLSDGSRLEGVPDFVEGHLEAEDATSLVRAQPPLELIDEQGGRRPFRVLSYDGDRFEIDMAVVG